MYRSSWICGKAVDTIAEDMTKAGIELQSELKAEDEEAIWECWADLNIWERIRDSIRWGRLYGGGLAVVLIDGQDLSTPLRIEAIEQGSFKGIQPLDRWQATPNLTYIVRDYGADMGLPYFYQTNQDRLAPLPGGLIHYTRCNRFIGQILPYWQAQTEMLWGQSVLERIIDRIQAFDSTTDGAAQLAFKAHLRVISIKGLRQVIANGGDILAGLQKQLDFMRRTQTNEGLTVLDADDKMEAFTYTFSGLDNLLLQMGQQLSGSIDIPLVKLFGQSPAGLNATGESDLQLYGDNIKQRQSSDLRRLIHRLLDITSMSLFGTPMPKGFNFTFRPIRGLNDTEKATVAKTGMEAISLAGEMGMTQKAQMQEMRNLGRKTDIGNYITDDDIEAADDVVAPPVSAADLLGQGEDDNPFGGSAGNDGPAAD